MNRLGIALAMLALALGSLAFGRTRPAAALVVTPTDCATTSCTFDYVSDVAVTCGVPLGHPFGFRGERCLEPYATTVHTAGVLAINFDTFSFEGAGNCSDIAVQFHVDGVPRYTSPFLSPGQQTGYVDVGPVAAGDHQVLIYATGRPGGCNTGHLSSWSGTAQFKVSNAVQYHQSSVAVTCNSTGQLCSPAYQEAVSTTGNIFVRFTASPSHCSNINVRISVDGVQWEVLINLFPGQNAGIARLANLSQPSEFSAGTHTLSLQAEGIPGGCNTGDLASWSGTLEVWTSQ